MESHACTDVHGHAAELWPHKCTTAEAGCTSERSASLLFVHAFRTASLAPRVEHASGLTPEQMHRGDGGAGRVGWGLNTCGLDCRVRAHTGTVPCLHQDGAS